MERSGASLKQQISSVTLTQVSCPDTNPCPQSFFPLSLGQQPSQSHLRLQQARTCTAFLLPNILSLPLRIRLIPSLTPSHVNSTPTVPSAPWPSPIPTPTPTLKAPPLPSQRPPKRSRPLLTSRPSPSRPRPTTSICAVPSKVRLVPLPSSLEPCFSTTFLPTYTLFLVSPPVTSRVEIFVFPCSHSPPHHSDRQPLTVCVYCRFEPPRGSPDPSRPWRSVRQRGLGWRRRLAWGGEGQRSVIRLRMRRR
jgi:hypothetical protein